MKTRIVKIEKGCFCVEYKTGLWSSWKTIDKTFRTKTKAEQYIYEKLKNGKQDKNKH